MFLAWFVPDNLVASYTNIITIPTSNHIMKYKYYHKCNTQNNFSYLRLNTIRNYNLITT